MYLVVFVALALLEKERRDYSNLRLTWQMANDQFLEDQRLLMIDMRRLESVLTEEQQRRVAGTPALTVALTRFISIAVTVLRVVLFVILQLGFNVVPTSFG